MASAVITYMVSQSAWSEYNGCGEAREWERLLGKALATAVPFFEVQNA